MRNTYIVLTEYQLLHAINIATEVYNSDSNLNIIYIVRDGKRLKSLRDDKEIIFNNIKSFWVLNINIFLFIFITDYIIILLQKTKLIFFTLIFTICLNI